MRKKTRLERALGQQLTPEQYARRRHATPYLYTLGRGDAALTFVGAHHTNDPNDSLLSVIDRELETKQPDLVIVEGLQNLSGHGGDERFISGLTEEQAVERGGEAVYTVHRALGYGVPWLSPEPSDAALARELLGSFYTKEQVLAWYTLRLLGQYHRREEKLPFSAYVAPFLVEFQRQTNWPNFAYTLESALAIAAPLVGHEIRQNNRERAGEYTDPIPWPGRWETQTLFNDMTRVALALRDRTLMRQIAVELEAGKKLLVVYGAGHAVMQEPAWEFYFRNA